METLQQTRVIRDRNGWHASTRVELAHSRVLELRTRRHSSASKLVTRATVSTVEGSFLSHAVGYGTASGDFSQNVIVESRSRITEKVVREQHEAALSQIDRIRATVAAFYEAQQVQQTCDPADPHSGERHAPGA